MRSALRRRGVPLEPPGGEDPERHERRLETALMALFRDTRQEAAFETLYLRTRSSLLTWIVHLLVCRGQEDDPAELLQDTFVNVYRYAGGFRDSGANTFRGWVRTIAANVVRRACMARAIARQTTPLVAGELAEPFDRRAGPEFCALAREEIASLRAAWILLLLHYGRAFQKLSPRDRQALHMIEVEGLSYAQAGQRLGVGRSNMKMIMFRSRKRIRAHILGAMAVEANPALRAAV